MGTWEAWSEPLADLPQWAFTTHETRALPVVLLALAAVIATLVALWRGPRRGRWLLVGGSLLVAQTALAYGVGWLGVPRSGEPLPSARDRFESAFGGALMLAEIVFLSTCAALGVLLLLLTTSRWGLANALRAVALCGVCAVAFLPLLQPWDASIAAACVLLWLPTELGVWARRAQLA
ncbi:MAG: hypothetical protein IT378_24845 [Sandaracinaceae bacterium]|nr:hypothetical protein [Sandaracinaceae bacterium]